MDNNLKGVLWCAVAAKNMFFLSTFQFFVSTFQFFVSALQFFVTSLKRSCLHIFLKKLLTVFVCVCAVLKKNVSTVFFGYIIVTFYVIFNVLRKRVKDHTCLYYAIVIFYN